MGYIGFRVIFSKDAGVLAKRMVGPVYGDVPVSGLKTTNSRAYAEHTAQEFRHDAPGIQHMLNRDTGFEAYLETAPTCHKGLFSRHVKQRQCMAAVEKTR